MKLFQRLLICFIVILFEVILLLPWSKIAQAQGPECVNGYYEMFWNFESGLGEWVNDPNGHFFQDAFGYLSSYSMSRDNNNDGGTINLLQSSMLAKLGLPANTTIAAQNIRFEGYYYSGGNTWYRFNLVNEQEEVIFKEEAVSSGHCSFGAWCLRTANLSIPGDLNRITINAWGLYASRFDNLKIGIPCSNFSSTYAIYLPLINKGPDIYPFGMNPAAPNLTHSFDYPVAPVSASSVKESLPGTQPDNYTVDKSQFLDETKITLESNNHLTPQIIIISPTINLDHETGNLSQYSGTSAFGSSQVTVVNSAAYNSSYGLKVDTIAGSGANQAWAYKTLSPWPMNQMAVGFYFNSTGIIGNTSDSIEIFEIDSNGPDFANIRLIKATGGGTSIEVNLFDGDGFSPPKKVTEVVSNGWHKVEIVMDEATTGIATDGRATVWFDGVLLNSFTGLNNYNLFNNVETVYFGLFDRLPSSNNIAGTVLIDEIVIGTSSFALYLPFISKGPDIYPFGVNPATSDLTHSFVD